VILNLLLLVQEAAPRPPSSTSFLFIIGSWAVIAYFFFIRPGRKREKKHKERIGELRKGDEVITAGGIVGKVVHLTDDRVTVKSDESRFVLVRARIADVLGDEPEEKK
jgi:preprotein translocase subunit YajC